MSLFHSAHARLRRTTVLDAVQPHLRQMFTCGKGLFQPCTTANFSSSPIMGEPFPAVAPGRISQTALAKCASPDVRPSPPLTLILDMPFLPISDVSRSIFRNPSNNKLRQALEIEVLCCCSPARTLYLYNAPATPLICRQCVATYL